MSNNDGNVTPFATLATIMISKQYTLDMSTYGALLAVITLVLKYLMSDEIKEKISMFSITDWMSFTNFCVLSTISFCVYLMNKHRYYVKVYAYRMIGQKKEIVKYRLLVINSYDESKTFIEYADKFPEFFEKPKEANIGILSYDKTGETNRPMIYSEDRRVANGIKVKFVDTNFNVKGYYVWKRHEMTVGAVKETGKDIVKTMNCIELYVDDRTCTDLLKYFSDIEKLVLQKRGEDRNYVSYYARFTSIPKAKKDEDEKPNKVIVANECYSIYEGVRKPIEELEKQYLDTFFCPAKNVIWPIVKQIHINPMKFFEMGQSPQSGWLIHGPPGTGKSSFAYRVAMTLQRHVVCIDIRGMVKRSAVFAAVRKPWLFSNIYTDPSKVVYLFDEIDLMILELYNKQKKKQKTTEDWMKMMKSSNGFKKISAQTESESKSEDDNDMSLSSMMGESKDDMTCDDLLEFFQGPIPYKGAIFMATTNKLDEIKRMCPALVRPGRLTPIEFGNPDSSTVKEIAKFHFGKEMELSDDYSPTISSSQIMQYVLDAKMSDEKGYDYFVKCVKTNVGANNKKIAVRDVDESE